MKAYYLGSKGFEAREQVPPSSLGPEEVLVRVQAVCLEPRDLRTCGPHAPGGALVGLVQACGEAATAFAGVRVLVSALQACGECPSCRRGIVSGCASAWILGQSSDGGCSETVVANARWLTRMDGPLAIEGDIAAVAAGPALSAYSLYCRAGASPGEPMLIVGRGPRAALLAALAETRGGKVIRFEGANEQFIASELARLDVEGRPQRIFLCEASEDEARLALRCASQGSVIAVDSAPAQLDLARVVSGELSVVGLPYAHPDLLTECAALVAKGELLLDAAAQIEPIADASPEAVERAFAANACLVLQHSPS